MATGVLVPLDGSSFAEQALPCAMRLGQGLPAELVLFRAVSTPPDAWQVLGGAGLWPKAGGEDLVTRANDYLQGVVLSLQESNPNVRYVVQHGSAARAIVDYAAKMDMEQIVMATHGYSGLGRWTKGSVAERVVQAARAPVLLVRGCEGDTRDVREPLSCRRVLVPLDGSQWAEQVLPPMTALAQALGCEVILFHVAATFLFESSSEAAERMARAYLTQVASCLKEKGIKASVATGTGLVAESIVQFAETHHVDLVAMSTHGRTGIARWVLGNVAARVLHTGSTPVLLVRATGQLSRHGSRGRIAHCHSSVTASSRHLSSPEPKL